MLRVRKNIKLFPKCVSIYFQLGIGIDIIVHFLTGTDRELRVRGVGDGAGARAGGRVVGPHQVLARRRLQHGQ